MITLEKRQLMRIGAMTIGLAGLLAASVAAAGNGGDGDDSEFDDDDDDDHDDDNNKGKKAKQPRFEDEGDSLKAELEVRGLKKRRVRAELEATAEVEIECRPKKGKKDKKHKKFTKELDIELEGIEFFRKDEIKGDRLDVEVETEEAEDVLDDQYGDDGGCPDGYNRRIKAVSFLDAKLAIEQGKNQVVTWLCTFDDPTRDGDVPRKDVDCHRL